MEIIEVNSLVIPDIKIIKYTRYCDIRGYFSEQFRKSDFHEHPDMTFMTGIEFVQANESFSKKGVVRGLHFQWNPFMGKLVRTLTGRMVDMILDIRKGSQYYGKIITYEMPKSSIDEYGEWIWIPPGFAHGNYFTEDTTIEYLCSGEYNSFCEAGISTLSKDIDWSLCNYNLKNEFDDLINSGSIVITDKDRDSFSFNTWKNDKRSDVFIHNQ
jgi:dTDP-4-dehydrorhamnose 3,5-epimerase